MSENKLRFRLKRQVIATQYHRFPTTRTHSGHKNNRPFVFFTVYGEDDFSVARRKIDWRFGDHEGRRRMRQWDHLATGAQPKAYIC